HAYRALFEGAGGVAPGAEGLVMLPYFSGERTPINDPHARGVLAGLTLAHTRDHVFRAVLESVAYGIRHNVEAFRELGASIDHIAAVGGGAQTELWPQIVSDASGVEQVLARETVGASFGDAFLAGLAAGLFDRSRLASWVETRSTVRPDPLVAPIYERGYRAFRELYLATRELVHRLGREGATA
ncbi:MAG: FGGY-family carbohydrate kinase, partial [Trueperaceae bacterium]|nr:FGGY-family carbohydrate kinase [Trueperaceae bacterium]